MRSGTSSRRSGTLALAAVLVILEITMRQATASASLSGYREPCTNEGEEVKISHSCFKCICKNGFVECEQQSCPAVDDCFIMQKRDPEACCEKCIGCLFEGRHIDSGTEWTDPEDPCMHYKCVSGVVTRSEMKCYTPCSNPIAPRKGQCCPTCFGCQLNGQKVLGEATLSEDPCVKCTCAGHKLTCTKKSCPVLQCPLTKQIRTPGECCPRCGERREEITNGSPMCILGKLVCFTGNTYRGDQCSDCTCQNGTSVCHKNTCPILECAVEDQMREPGECCPSCPVPAEIRSTCTNAGKVYQNNETWSLNACTSCECRAGEVRCANIQCPKRKCGPNESLVRSANECCPQCVESPGVCTVFGDPHYKTFDGNFYSFQGSCKYQLTADCVGHTFSIRVTNDARMTKYSSWTKTVTLKLEGVKVNLGHRMRVKVNGTRVEPPYKLAGTLDIYRSEDDTEVIVETGLGVKLSWDGFNFIQVQVPTVYKGKLCGLCGNYNSVFRDDLFTRAGLNMTHNVWRFARSWAVGGPKACTRQRKNELGARHPQCKTKKFFTFCKPLRTAEVFGNCNSLLNPDNYFESCKFDMCECPHRQCYCDSMAAYAHECVRQGVQLPDWRTLTGCSRNATLSASAAAAAVAQVQKQLLEQQQQQQQQQRHHRLNAINRNAIHRQTKKPRRPAKQLEPQIQEHLLLQQHHQQLQQQHHPQHHRRMHHQQQQQLLLQHNVIPVRPVSGNRRTPPPLQR
ncbi:BMP-binding endothelial regulator protein-like isoform X2 [Anopheles albimanus]|nr:BMP-binding endothelial regulator protein-like isoform X2 [Anopheles albimanus]XP_035786653.1 BMP-binding endothelial regulator protein-like isoform X2 [Anopheles albimanus]XP_035786654.1 BMP-binding endothelial regulator protein-like isoform X2 [Anopheles albimanus]